MAYLSMYSRAVSLSFEPYVLGDAYHWQKWKASSFSPWHFEHKTLPRVSDTRISVLGGLLVARIPPTRNDSTAPRIGRRERISRSRFRRAYRLWCMWCVLGRGAGEGRGEIGAISPDRRKCFYRVLSFDVLRVYGFGGDWS